MAGNVGQTLQDIDIFENAEPARKGPDGQFAPSPGRTRPDGGTASADVRGCGLSPLWAVAHRPVGSAGAGMCAARGFR